MRTQYKDSQYTLTPHKVEVLINSAKNLRDKIIVESAYFPALRRFEIAKLKVEDIDFNTGRIIVFGKYNKVSPIPVGSIYPQYMTDLKHYINFIKKRSGYLFGNKKPLNISRINQIFNEIAEKSSIKHPNPKPRMNSKGKLIKRKINPHLLRHSQARFLKDQGFNIEFIKNYLRHDSIKSTMDVYGTLGIDEMEKIAYQRRGIEHQEI